MRISFGDSFAVAAARATVRRHRDKPVDHQEDGPQDATLMVRKDGVGTITFDTSTGSTDVSGMKAGSVVRTWVLDGNLTPDAVRAEFEGMREDDLAKAESAYEGDLSTVESIVVFPDVVAGRAEAEAFVDKNSRKWEWVAAVRFTDDDGAERWMMGGNLSV